MSQYKQIDCECNHCKEIVNQQNRLQELQRRRKYNAFIEKAAREVRPDL
jgi:hypothetical protein|tara:strand:+ start:676 stop:822 length:147 start_codon:yes stop_codon:yes gene_type:complete